jgi:hypothetical protein
MNANEDIRLESPTTRENVFPKSTMGREARPFLTKYMYN